MLISKLEESKTKGDLKVFEYGEEFELEELNISLGKQKTLVVYLSDECKSCLDVVPIISRFIEIVPENILKTTFVWEDDIPTEYLSKWKIFPEDSHSLNKKIRLAPSPGTGDCC